MEMIRLPVPQLVTPLVSGGLSLLTKAKGSVHDHLTESPGAPLLSGHTGLEHAGSRTVTWGATLGKVVCTLGVLPARSPRLRCGFLRQGSTQLWEIFVEASGVYKPAGQGSSQTEKS